MVLPKAFYDNTTIEQIEEYIEFVDWSLVPLNLITEEFILKFSDIKIVKIIVWMQDILYSCEIKHDQMPFINTTLLLRDEKCYVEINNNSDKLKVTIAHKEVLLAIEENFRIGITIDMVGIVRNIIKWQFGLEEFAFNILDEQRQKGIQRYFYNIT